MGAAPPHYWRRRYQSIRHAGCMTDMDACLIESVLTSPRQASQTEIRRHSGYSVRDCLAAMCKLRHHGLIERVNDRGLLVTDKGKLALALWRGKQRKRREVREAA